MNGNFYRDSRKRFHVMLPYCMSAKRNFVIRYGVSSNEIFEIRWYRGMIRPKLTIC